MMIENIEDKPALFHPIFLYFYSLNLENLYRSFKDNFRFQIPVQIMIILIHSILIFLRLLLIFDSSHKNAPDIFKYELLWFFLQLGGSAIDLICFYVKSLNKGAGIFTIIISSYITFESSYHYYFFLNYSGQYYFSAYSIPTILIGFISGIYICYNYFIFLVSCLISYTLILSLTYSLLPNLLLSNKIGLPIMVIVMCICQGMASFHFEKVIRTLFYKNEENKRRMRDLTNLFNVFPNEILLISGNKDIFINTSFKNTFLLNCEKVFTSELTYTKLIKIGSKLKLEESENLTFNSILTNKEKKSQKYQNKVFIYKQSKNNAQHFTYRFATLEFNSLDSWVYIFSNLSITLELEKEKYDKKAKRILLSQITHDMRTPINSMLCSEEVLENTELNQEQKGILNLLKISTNMILNLVNDSLDLYLDEENSLKATISKFDPKKLINESINLLHHSFNSKGVSLKPKFISLIPLQIISDENRLRRIIMNLLGNALKFTPRNGNVRIKAEQLEERKLLVISIKDNGPGISPENLKNLFTRLNKLKETSSTNLTGLGIGLSVCKSLSKLLGGNISVDSRLGKGSKFTFWISTELQETQDSDSDQASIRSNFIKWSSQNLDSKSISLNENINNESFQFNPDKLDIDHIEVKSHNRMNNQNSSQIFLDYNKINKEDKKRIRILLVDDNIPTVDIMASYCTKLNIIYDKCYDGVEAIEIIQANMSENPVYFFDFIIMDNEMPQMTGIIALRKIKNLLNDFPKKPVFIIVTGSEEEELKKEIESLGGIYAKKPITFAFINKIINE